MSSANCAQKHWTAAAKTDKTGVYLRGTGRDVGFAIKVFTYGKTYVKLELAEVVLLERRTEEIGKATQITQALRTANVEEGSESELSELESDLEMNMA